MRDDEDREFLAITGRWVAGGATPTWGREADAAALIATLRRGRSVLLVGPARVGKSSVVHAAAAHVDDELTGFVQLSTAQLLVGTKYLGEWQTRLDAVVRHAQEAGAVLWLTDVANLLTAGSTSTDGTAMFDALAPRIAAGEVRLVGELTPEQHTRLERKPGFVDLFVRQTVAPLSADAVDAAVAGSAVALGLELDDRSRRVLVALTTRFMPSRPQPGPALDLLPRVKDYQVQKASIGEPEAASPAFVERVFSIYTGLPRFVVSTEETRPASEIRAWFSERLVGQHEAIEAVTQAITLFKAGLNDPSRPLGTFLFVGPTGVGKTELARALATWLFGSAHRLLRFDLGEYKDWSSFERLLGDPRAPDQPALLADAVRAQPFQVVLFDELEKAHPNVLDTLLAVLDEGRLTTPRGEVVDLRSTFVICTSNLGAVEAERGVGFGANTDPARRRDRLLSTVEQHLRPELLNRFQHVVPFHPLDAAQAAYIVRQELRDLLRRDGISARNLVVEVDDAAVDLVVRHGFDPRWGARGLKRELQRRVVMPLATTLMEHAITPGQILKVTGADGRIRVRQLDTDASRELRREEATPIELNGRHANPDDVREALRAAREDLEALAVTVDMEGLLTRQETLSEARAAPTFWGDNTAAARALRDLDRVTRTLDRIERLRSRHTELEAELATSPRRARMVHLAARTGELGDAVRGAWRELVWMGEHADADALLEVRPLAAGRLARDTLVQVYTGWAEHRSLSITWLHDPMGDEEPAMFAVRGHHAFGWLRLEAGVHRVREGDDATAARVRVAPWTERTAPLVFDDHRALKAIGVYGGRIRSRLACSGGLVLQNGNTLADNRHLAMEVGGSWAEAPEASDVIVRRYDLQAPLVRDVLTGFSSGRPDAVSPPRLHELLALRVDAAASGPDAA